MPSAQGAPSGSAPGVTRHPLSLSDLVPSYPGLYPHLLHPSLYPHLVPSYLLHPPMPPLLPALEPAPPPLHIARPIPKLPTVKLEREGGGLMGKEREVGVLLAREREGGGSREGLVLREGGFLLARPNHSLQQGGF